MTYAQQIQRLPIGLFTTYTRLPDDVKAEIERQFDYHERCCAKCGIKPDYLFVSESVQEASRLGKVRI